MIEIVETIREKLGTEIDDFIEKAAPGEGHLTRIGFNEKERESLRKRWQDAVRLTVANSGAALAKIGVGTGTGVLMEKTGRVFSHIAYKLEIPGILRENISGVFPFPWDTHASRISTYGSVAFDVLANICWRMGPVAMAAGAVWAIPHVPRAISSVMGWMQTIREQKHMERQSIAQAGQNQVNLAILPPLDTTNSRSAQIESPKS